MAARRNTKLREGRWPWARGAGAWLLGKTRTGIAAIGIRGALLVALAIVAVWGVCLAKRQAGRMPQFRVYPARFRADAPEWCAEDLATVEFPRESYSIFDPALTRDVAAAYHTCPWVAAVTRVAKQFPNQLHVHLELRTPAAFVRLPAACHAVDAKATYLPLDHDRWDHQRWPLPYIWGVHSEPPEPGQPWPDRRVRVAASVLATLAADPKVLQHIHIINVANLDGEVDPLRSEILLSTHRGVRIDWGRPPDTTKFHEPPAGEKLARLRRCLARPLGRGAIIDLRFPDTEAMARE